MIYRRKLFWYSSLKCKWSVTAASYPWTEWYISNVCSTTTWTLVSSSSNTWQSRFALRTSWDNSCCSSAPSCGSILLQFARKCTRYTNSYWRCFFNIWNAKSKAWSGVHFSSYCKHNKGPDLASFSTGYTKQSFFNYLFAT